MNKDYYSLPDYVSKKQFLASMVVEHGVHRRRVDEESGLAKSAKRKISREYFVIIEDSRVRVCRKFFCATYSISIKVINKAMNGKSSSGVFTKPDGRQGKPAPNKTPDDRIQMLSTTLIASPEWNLTIVVKTLRNSTYHLSSTSTNCIVCIRKTTVRELQSILSRKTFTGMFLRRVSI